jgi:hypothetical protein
MRPPVDGQPLQGVSRRWYLWPAQGAVVQGPPEPRGPVSARQSKNPEGPALLFTADVFSEFIAAVRNETGLL